MTYMDDFRIAAWPADAEDDAAGKTFTLIGFEAALASGRGMNHHTIAKLPDLRLSRALSSFPTRENISR